MVARSDPLGKIASRPVRQADRSCDIERVATAPHLARRPRVAPGVTLGLLLFNAILVSTL
jgi:hypothetical protein